LPAFSLFAARSSTGTLGALKLPIDSEVRARLDHLELPFNSYGIDPYGISKETIGFFMSAVKPFYRTYFSCEAHGLEHIPERGRAMLIGNHSGGTALDGLMVVSSCFFELDPPRIA
jgi:1-acyl-sn-glycerol-3-phosphate acyltransferase